MSINKYLIEKMRLTKHFTYAEMTRTDTGLPNDPEDFFVRHQLLHTARILERVRRRVGFPLPINSGFRTLEVNDAIEPKGSPNSYHLDGRAVDISTIGMSVGKRDCLLRALSDENPVELIEKATIIHVAF